MSLFIDSVVASCWTGLAEFAQVAKKRGSVCGVRSADAACFVLDACCNAAAQIINTFIYLYADGL